MLTSLELQGYRGFFGHRLEPNSRFRLDDDGGFGPLSASLVDPDPQASFFPDSLADDDGTPALALALQIDSKESKLRRANVLSDGSLVLSGPPRRFQPEQESALPPVELITIDTPSVTPLTKSWDEVLRASRESEAGSRSRINCDRPESTTCRQPSRQRATSASARSSELASAYG